MFTIDPLFEAQQHRQRLRAEAAAKHLRAPTTRQLLAGALRKVADRLDPGTVAPLQRRTGRTKTPLPSSTMRTFAP